MINFRVSGSVNGVDEVERMLAYAPVAMRRAVTSWFFKTKKNFVGQGRRAKGGFKPGVYRNALMKRKLTGGRGNISRQYIGAFRGRVKPGALSHLEMDLGLPKNPDNGFMQAIERRENGGFVSHSSGGMPIPIWRNLKRYGYRTASQARKAMKHRLTPVSASQTGSYLLIDEKHIAPLKDRALFIVKKTQRIPGFKHKFESSFLNRWPMYVKRGQRAVDRRIRQIQKGYGRYGKNPFLGE